MPDALPHSPLITPDLRRQLQQQYEAALRLLSAPAPDFRRVHDLLGQCVRADPGNILYLDALLANLRRWQPKASWWAKWFSRSVPGTRYSVLSTEYALLQVAPERLLGRLDDRQLLGQLAAAAGACDFDEVELRYCELAAAAGDADSLRGLAQALTRQGRFEQAAAAWEKVLAAALADGEATRALADLDQRAARAFDDDERALTDAQAVGGPLLEILGRREELQLARARHRLFVAHRRAAADPHPKAAALVGRLQSEYDRLEIEMLHVRCERLPGQWRLRLELAQRLKQAGNYSGAIQRLEEAGKIQPGEAAVLIELGECWQHLRQFAKALDLYRAAIPAAFEAQGFDPVAPDDDLKLALYRAGVLEAAMNQPQEAREHFTHVLALDSQFRDARERLDKLPGS